MDRITCRGTLDADPLRLRRGLSGIFSDAVNRKIPKVVGSVMVAAGVVLLAATAFGYRME